MPISVAQYAESRGVSQAAIRKQLSRYSAELEDHITFHNRKRLLDDAAVAFLDAHRQQREVIIEQSNKQSRRELDTMRAELDAMKDKLLEAREKMILLQEESKALISQNTESRYLIAAKEKEVESLQGRLEQSLSTSAEMKVRAENAEKEALELKKKADQTEKEAEELKARAEAAEKEASSFTRSWFGLYRKVER